MNCTVVIDTFSGVAAHAAAISCVESLVTVALETKQCAQNASSSSSISDKPLPLPPVSSVHLCAASGPGDAAATATTFFHARQLRDAYPDLLFVHDSTDETAVVGAGSQRHLDAVCFGTDSAAATAQPSSIHSSRCVFFCFAREAPSKEVLILLRQTIVRGAASPDANKNDSPTHVVVISSLVKTQEGELRAVLEAASSASVTASSSSPTSSPATSVAASSSQQPNKSQPKKQQQQQQQQQRSVFWLRAAHLSPPVHRPANSAVPLYCNSSPELFCAGVALGVTRSLPFSAAQNADIVPFDIAVNTALLALAALPRKPPGARSATSDARSRDLRVVSLVAPPTEGLCWGMWAEYVLDYYARYENEIVAASGMPAGSFQRGASISFAVQLRDLWNSASSLATPFDAYRSMRSSAKKSGLISSPHSATSNKIRSVLRDMDAATEFERRDAPHFRSKVDEDEEDTYGMLLRILSQKRETAPLVLRCSLTAVQWESYVKQLSLDVLKFLAVRIMQLPSAPKDLPAPTPMWHNDVFFTPHLRAPPNPFPLRRWFESAHFGLRTGLQPNGGYVHVEAGTSVRRFLDILAQPHVQSVVSFIAKRDNIDRSVVEKKALNILAHIGDTTNHRDARMAVASVRAVFKSLYTHVNVLPPPNLLASFNRLWAATRTPRTCVVLVPSHRSYVDFCVTSYLLLSMGLPLPHICAGEDFLRLGPLATALRGSGAFFMRRSFKTDKLYAALFKEYVKGIVLKSGGGGGDGSSDVASCLEFFIEGMRSRSGKTMPPRMGILKMITDSFFEDSERINDVLFVPVSLSYERLLESSLYARELLGIPKPPENLPNLVRGGMSVLQEAYGSLNVNFGEPISLVKTAEQVLRATATAATSTETATATAISALAVRGETDPKKRALRSFTPAPVLTALAGRIAHSLDNNLVVTPSSVVASVLLYMTDVRDLRKEGVTLDRIAVNVEWLRGTVLRLGGTMSPGFAEKDGSGLLSYATPLLAPHVSVSRLSALRIGPGNNNNTGEVVDERTAITNLMALAIYHNQMMHLFVTPAAVCVILAAARHHSRNNNNNTGSANQTQQQQQHQKGDESQLLLISSGIDVSSNNNNSKTEGGTTAAATQKQRMLPAKDTKSLEEETRWLHSILSAEFYTFADDLTEPGYLDPFADGCAKLRQLGLLSTSGSETHLVDDTTTNFCAMTLYPFIEGYFMAAVSLFALADSFNGGAAEVASGANGIAAGGTHSKQQQQQQQQPRLDEHKLLSVCHRVALDLHSQRLLTFAQSSNKELLKTALGAFRTRGVFSVESADTDLAAQARLAPNFADAHAAELRILAMRINRLRWHPHSSADVNLCIQAVVSAARNSNQVLAKL